MSIYSMHTARFAEWLMLAERHEKCMYYRGPSMIGIEHKSPILEAAWRAALAGKVYLVQGRDGHELYCYLAIRAGRVPIKRLVAQPIQTDQRRKYTKVTNDRPPGTPAARVQAATTTEHRPSN